jgi:glutathione S-transferase
MDYVKPEEARGMSGVRLVLTKGAISPWGQALKKMLELKGVPYVPVEQVAGEANEVLVAWTGVRNAPTIVVDDQPAVSRWFDQLSCVERLQPQLSLVPNDSASRIEVFGIINELAGDWGLGWARRLMLLREREATDAASGGVPAPIANIMNTYGFSHEAAVAAGPRVADILETLTGRLKRQRANGSRFLVGSQLTAADIYWACFSNFVDPLPDDICPMPAEFRAIRQVRDPQVAAALDPVLIEHRDEIFRRYLGPIWF